VIDIDDMGNLVPAIATEGGVVKRVVESVNYEPGLITICVVDVIRIIS
jgi:hypothetical protein